MKSDTLSRLLLFFFSCQLLCATTVEEVASVTSAGSPTTAEAKLSLPDTSKSILTRFSLRQPSEPEEDVCYIIPGNADSLHSCNFNLTSKTFIVIHGWTVSGMFESWVPKLVAALYERERDANVIVVDWLNRAHQHYSVAAENTKLVGCDIAWLIDWMEETANIPLENVHLIGYSLGAHVAGFAGSHTTNKVGRITGFSEAVKCEHERSIHLFIDSLLHKQEPSLAYRCSSKEMFDHGFCLSCRKHRCNTVGYDVQPVRNRRSTKMFTRTRATMPFRVYHYQLKIQFSDTPDHAEVNPTLTASLYGTKGDTENLKLNIKEKITPNKTQSFLLVTEVDLGELLMIQFRWEESASWSSLSLLKMFSTWWSGEKVPDTSVPIHRIRVKSGEAQMRMVFCSKDSPEFMLDQALTFVRCQEGWKRQPNRPATKTH
ncbi:lipoprotein lipase isoform X2 [Polypterus senegalus]|uniref:lipoprotein lipase isoform X2 n=1 Tax=Polypterus senegalus TaxID=55291 RepID=UPI001965386A|nr:lipoprotein lipase isoform X2 [Polypterus senegalus]